MTIAKWMLMAVLSVAPMIAGDVPGQCLTGCTFLIQIGNINDYQIYISWTAFASKGVSATFTGKGTTHNYVLSGRGFQYTIHADYIDKDGITTKSAAGAVCGNQVKFSYTGHGNPPRCPEYNEAAVTIRRVSN
jgi:hypothetical protein